MRVCGTCTEATEIGRGVRQGCLLSPVLFNLYAETMMKEALEDVEEGVRVGGSLIPDVRFADDQAMTAGSESGLQKIMNRVNDTGKEYGMKINVKKTKVMVVSKEERKEVRIMVDGQRVEQVPQFKYLGAWMTEDGRCELEVKTRIAMAKEAFSKRRELLTKGLCLATKKKIVKVLVWSVALYGCETWALKKAERGRLESFEMWVWRRMEKISWVDKVTNMDVLKRVDERRMLLEEVIKRQKQWIGHVLRGEGLLKNIIEGKMEGKRCRGRKRVGMLDGLMGEGYAELKERAQDRQGWREWMPWTCLRTEH